MDIQALRKLKADELTTRLREKRSELSTHIADLKMGKDNNSAKIKELKKEIAKILTLLNSENSNN
ncbi:50S ribosomal protein L29 [Candidatus Dojkabacteria bacterium]|uniref:Large ribosomal subunit protein uL29 n=1 Tax=Candidatus Dojkabacteria bacterium TaxID=2099670 RepID=A0A955L833_9BACT|nr:50S ribosomal protein L29 [Candidatus Dojkabacteria bacterium]